VDNHFIEIMSTPSFTEALIEAYPKLTGKPVSDLGIKKLLLIV